MAKPAVNIADVAGKFGVSVSGVDADGKPWAFRQIGRASDARDYWEGE